MSADLSAKPRRVGAQIAFPTVCGRRPGIALPLDVARDGALREVLGAVPAVSHEQLIQAARVVFCELHELLRGREGERVHGRERYELWQALHMPVIALTSHKGIAKRLQLEWSGGRPLTVCFGRRERALPLDPPNHVKLFPHGDGCGLIHPDSTGLRRPSFRYYCATCRKRETLRQRTTTATVAAELQGRVEITVYNNAWEPIPAWQCYCTSCGDYFTTTNPKIRRCDQCRESHF